METKLPAIDYERLGVVLAALDQAHDELDSRAQTAAHAIDAARLGRCAQAAEVAHRALFGFLDCMASYGNAGGAVDAISGL